MTLAYTVNGAALTQKIAPSGINITHRADGDPSQGGLPIEDPAAALAMVGWKPVTVKETLCAQPRLFTGFTMQRDIGRSLEGGLFVGEDARLQDLTVTCLNAIFGFRVITRTGTGGGNRPAETWADRLTWILESEYLNEWISDDQTWVVTNTTMMEETDYRGSYAASVMEDLVDRSGGAYIYFAFYDTTAHEIRLFFDNDSESLGLSAISISNDWDDVDNDYIFAPDSVAKLSREADQVYSDVVVTYDKGAKKVYRYRPSTAATYVRRGTEIQRPYTKGLATATAQGEKFLDKHAVEVDRISCSIQVPANRVGLIEAGQGMTARFTHLPGYETGTVMRIVSYSPRPTNDLATHYDVALELVGARPTIVEGCDCVEGDDGVLTTGIVLQEDWELWRLRAIGPIYVPAHCTLTVDSYEWTGYASPTRPDQGYALTTQWLDAEDNFPPSTNLSYTPGADLGRRYTETVGNGFNLDPGAGPVIPGWTWPYTTVPPLEGTELSGETFTNGTDDDVPIWLSCSNNPSFESVGTFSITANYHCGEPGEDDEEIDLGPTPGATTIHTTDPTVDDDETLGYTTPGMLWVNTTSGEVFVLVDGADGAAVWVSTTATGLVYAPTTADYLVGTAQGGLSAEIVVGTTPGGELGGTWASPTVDATHSGSAHLALGATSSTAAAGDHGHAGVYVGELLMQDGVTSPPVPIENEAGDDWLYAD